MGDRDGDPEAKLQVRSSGPPPKLKLNFIVTVNISVSKCELFNVLGKTFLRLVAETLVSDAEDLNTKFPAP
jgi:hypothetical protein